MKRSNVLMLAAALLLACLYVLPLWNITLEAPQYPIPIGMNIYLDRFEGAGENDINNINIMNHYVGMKPIPQSIPEFSIFPYFVGGLIAIGVLVAFLGRRKLYLFWFALMLVLGSIAMYDFYLWEYDYGHDLKETAAIKFTDANGEPMTYQPPLIGAKKILNFRAISLPRSGAYVMVLSMGLAVAAFFLSGKDVKNKTNGAIAVVLLSLVAVSCDVKPQPINYGIDACDYCRMTIVDQQHAAQVVTEKGRAYKYDAIECMMNDLKKWDRPAVKYYLVADFSNPGTLTNAVQARFLISEKVPSPMGANLTAFADEQNRKKLVDSIGGETLYWDQLQEKFKSQ